MIERLKQCLVQSVLFSLCGIFALSIRVSAASKSNSKYMYEITKGNIYQLNLSTGKVKTTAISNGTGVQRVPVSDGVLEYKEYLYFTIDTFDGSYTDWPYICRVKKDGSGYEVLGKGCNPKIKNNKIYYTAYTFSTSASELSAEGAGKCKGVYRMDLNGKNQKKILNKYRLLFISGNNLYVTPSEKSKIVKCSLKGKAKKTIVQSMVGGNIELSAGTNMYVTDGKVYYDTSRWSDTKHEYVYYYTMLNLKTGKSETRKAKGMFAGGDKNYIFFATYSQGTLYYQKRGNGKEKKFPKSVSGLNPRILHYGNKDWTVAIVQDNTSQGRYLVMYNVKKKKMKTMKEIWLWE